MIQENLRVGESALYALIAFF